MSDFKKKKMNQQELLEQLILKACVLIRDGECDTYSRSELLQEFNDYEYTIKISNERRLVLITND